MNTDRDDRWPDKSNYFKKNGSVQATPFSLIKCANHSQSVQLFSAKRTLQEANHSIHKMNCIIHKAIVQFTKQSVPFTKRTVVPTKSPSSSWIIWENNYCCFFNQYNDLAALEVQYSPYLRLSYSPCLWLSEYYISRVDISTYWPQKTGKIVFCNSLIKSFADFYNITNAKGKVAKFILFKQAYKLGEDIVGVFDFSEGTVPCVQVIFFSQLIRVNKMSTLFSGNISSCGG